MIQILKVGRLAPQLVLDMMHPKESSDDDQNGRHEQEREKGDENTMKHEHPEDLLCGSDVSVHTEDFAERAVDFEAGFEGLEPYERQLLAENEAHGRVAIYEAVADSEHPLGISVGTISPEKIRSYDSFWAELHKEYERCPGQPMLQSHQRYFPENVWPGYHVRCCNIDFEDLLSQNLGWL